MIGIEEFLNNGKQVLTGYSNFSFCHGILFFLVINQISHRKQVNSQLEEFDFDFRVGLFSIVVPIKFGCRYDILRYDVAASMKV